jgi:glycosyltransferase involved in cell wall biosynthesis
VRILLVSHPPLDAELGAAQLALSLAAALRERGHDACAWSPEPLPAGTRWWNLWRRQRRALERFAAAHGPFEVIDAPAISVSRELARHGAVVARSVQPELRYLAHAVRSDLRQRRSPGALAHALQAAWQAAAVLGGWRRARTILCLGTDELGWMRRRFPGWAPKTRAYVCGLPAHERSALLAVRCRRRPAAPGSALRFLWIGRWAAHKGTRRLLRFLAERAAASPQEVFTLAGCGTLAERDVPAAWLRSGRVRIVPSFHRAELPALLAAHEVGLFTSDVEGWGLSLNEMLESGMTVFATEAGAVNDLRPYFPSTLRPFPPPREVELGLPEDLEASGYAERFSWPAIARSYERQLLGNERPDDDATAGSGAADPRAHERQVLGSERSDDAGAAESRVADARPRSAPP